MARKGPDFEQTSPLVHPRMLQAATYIVLVTEGPDRGASCSIHGTEASGVLVGQSEVCELKLTDPHVSRRHVALSLDNRRLRLVDLKSTNGTRVNDVLVAEALLCGGETIRIGESVLRVELGAQSTTIALPSATAFGRVIGASARMRHIYPLCEKIAKTDVPVLIEGETGVGKEILAESLHERSQRVNGPFIVFDCTSVPANLAESELFGHERGAFTGAVGSRRGIFEQANGGTLLIDEIGDLDAALQPKLLRALERREVKRVGGERAIKFDIRVLSATRRNLDEEVASGRFRDDLFHRFVIGRIELPPLRDRHGDVRILAEAFARQMGHSPSELPEALLSAWDRYAWPGNVRELKNAVTRRLALGELGEDVPSANRRDEPHDVIESVVGQKLGYVEARATVLRAFERRYLEAVLTDHDGNVMRAAAASGIARRHFQRVKARNT